MKNELEDHIRCNLDELDGKMPDAAVLGRIMKEMKQGKNGGPGGILIPFRLLKWAAACLLFAACVIALRYVTKQKPAIEVARIITPEKQPLQQPATDPVNLPPVEAADKNKHLPKNVFAGKAKAEQVASFAGLNNMQSAAGRMRAVVSVSGLKNNGNDVVDALVHILDNDPNTNVRLAALDGLTRFYREAYVRRKLVASLKKQHDPVMQVSLIALLVRMRESGILSDLEKMTGDERADKAVKDFAYTGILQLRPGTIN